jgi:hypothetical protein
MATQKQQAQQAARQLADALCSSCHRQGRTAAHGAARAAHVSAAALWFPAARLRACVLEQQRRTLAMSDRMPLCTTAALLCLLCAPHTCCWQGVCAHHQLQQQPAVLVIVGGAQDVAWCSWGRWCLIAHLAADWFVGSSHTIIVWPVAWCSCRCCRTTLFDSRVVARIVQCIGAVSFDGQPAISMQERVQGPPLGLGLSGLVSVAARGSEGAAPSVELARHFGEHHQAARFGMRMCTGPGVHSALSWLRP